MADTKLDDILSDNVGCGSLCDIVIMLCMLSSYLYTPGILFVEMLSVSINVSASIYTFTHFRNQHEFN